ncbi:hypothetical protein [Azospirillum argentinense]
MQSKRIAGMQKANFGHPPKMSFREGVAKAKKIGDAENRLFALR